MEEKRIASQQCLYCQSFETSKYGSVRGIARRKCRLYLKSYAGKESKGAPAGCTMLQQLRGRCKGPKGAPDGMKRMAVHMYLEGNGFSSIGRILSYSKTAVFYWVREAGNRLADNLPESLPVMEFDEMWHFVKKKVENYGFGLLMTGAEENPLPSRAVIGIRRRSRSFSGKSANSLRGVLN